MLEENIQQAKKSLIKGIHLGMLYQHHKKSFAYIRKVERRGG